MAYTILPETYERALAEVKGSRHTMTRLREQLTEANKKIEALMKSLTIIKDNAGNPEKVYQQAKEALAKIGEN